VFKESRLLGAAYNALHELLWPLASVISAPTQAISFSTSRLY
jgi:hypothetical protein